MPSPSPGSSFSDLRAVRTVSASDAWAVGTYSSGAGNQTLILHWDGTAWTQVPSPNPAHDNALTGVAATSAHNAWAVGFTGLLDQTLILHWDGTAWTQVPSPSPGPANDLAAVGATSTSKAWAVGFTDNGTTDRTLTLRWNGSTWAQVPSPNQGGATTANSLTGVAATSASNAWAVGRSATGTAHSTLILYWNGTKWARVPSPAPGSTSDLLAVAATSASNAWAVGSFTSTGPSQVLALHCC